MLGRQGHSLYGQTSFWRLPHCQGPLKRGHLFTRRNNHWINRHINKQIKCPLVFNCMPTVVLSMLLCYANTLLAILSPCSCSYSPCDVHFVHHVMGSLWIQTTNKWMNKNNKQEVKNNYKGSAELWASLLFVSLLDRERIHTARVVWQCFIFDTERHCVLVFIRGGPVFIVSESPLLKTLHDITASSISQKGKLSTPKHEEKNCIKKNTQASQQNKNFKVQEPMCI